MSYISSPNSFILISPSSMTSSFSLPRFASPISAISKISSLDDNDMQMTLKPLGLDVNLNNWIESKKSCQILTNLAETSKSDLESKKLKLQELHSEINDKFFAAFDNIPPNILSKFPNYNSKVHQSLKILNQCVKAKIRQTDRKLSNLDSVSLQSYCSNSETNVTVLMPEKSYEAMNNTSMRNVSNKMDDDKYEENRTDSELGRSLMFDIVMNSEFRGMKEYDQMREVSVSTKLASLPTSTITSKLNVGDTVKFNKQVDDIALENYDDFDDFSDGKKIQLKDLLSGTASFDLEEEFNNNEMEAPLEKSNDYKVKNKVQPSHANSAESNDNVTTLKFIGHVKNDGASGEFENFNFEHSCHMLDIFKTKFGLHQFRPNQLSAINAVILGFDCFILMPTGGGKSLCYQLPALLSPGITIVISPLRSLILDQTQKLQSLDIPATYLTADLSDAQVTHVYRKLSESNSDLKLLYVTPEKLMQSTKFSNSLKTLYQRNILSRFVIDEVHCVSQWGHDFRLDYKKLGLLKERFPNIPIVALTATATQRVRSDILHQLKLESPKWFISSFNRPNLRYTVIPKKAKSANSQVIGIIKEKFLNESGIIYCISRNDCDSQAKALINNGISAVSYHAGLTDKERIDRQSMWILDKVNVICATIAFGMGIDKPNVRYVLHASMPKSIESYYQESGRAGRDGEPADCIMLYSYGDVYRYRKIMEANEHMNAEALKTHLDNLHKIVYFCDNLADCRRALQLNYFGEKFERQDCINNAETVCDNCRTYHQFVNVDVTANAKALVKLVMTLDRVRKNNVTILQVVDIYKGSDVSSIQYKLGYDFKEYFGQGHSMTKHEIERLIHQLIQEEFLCENMQLNNGIVCAYVVPGRLAHTFLTTNNVEINMQRKKLAQQPKKSKAERKQPITQVSEVINVEIKDVEQRCHNELMEMVNGIAGALDVNVNSIMNIAALKVMSQKLPMDKAEMLRIPHVTKANFDKYGKALLDITQKYAKEKKELLKEEEQNQSCAMDLDDSESDSGWNNSRGKRSNDDATSYKSKKFKGNNDSFYNIPATANQRSMHDYVPFNPLTPSASSAFPLNSNAGNNSFGYQTYNTAKKYNRNYRKGNRKSARGFSSKARGRGRGNNCQTPKGPGLCQLTKKSFKKEN